MNATRSGRHPAGFPFPSGEHTHSTLMAMLRW